MDILLFRQCFRIDFYDRTNYYKMPVRFPFCNLINDLNIKSFVYYPIKSKSWVRNRLLVLRVAANCSGLLEMRFVDTTREGINGRVTVFFCFIETVATCKNQVGLAE